MLHGLHGLIGLLGCLAAPAVPTAVGTTVVASALRGDDAAGDGTAAAPFRTLTRALAEAAKQAPCTVEAEVGTYGEGETLPLALVPGVDLRGFGSQSTRLEGRGTLLRWAAPAAEASLAAPEVRLEGLALAGDGAGIVVHAAGGARGRLLLADLSVEGFQTGISLQADGAGELEFRADGLRSQECLEGLKVLGDGRHSIAISDSTFHGGQVGIALDAEIGAEIGATAATHHALAITGSRFHDCVQAGLRRSGACGRNAGSFLVDLSDFERCGIGIELQQPAGDVPIDVTRCSFVGNSSFGLQLVGQAGDPNLSHWIAWNTFRANGVGLHLSNSQVTCRLWRNRVHDSAGIGVFLANFMSTPGRVELAENWITDNGNAGLFVLADGRAIEIACRGDVLARNRASGIERKDRRLAKSTLAFESCTVVGNRPDLSKIAPGEVRGSTFAAGAEFADGNTLLSAESVPGTLFADWMARDYRRRDADGPRGPDLRVLPGERPERPSPESPASPASNGASGTGETRGTGTAGGRGSGD